MKLKLVLFLSCVLICILSLPDFSVKAKSDKIILSKTSATIDQGEELVLTLKNAPGKVKWSVSKKNIVSIKANGSSVRVTGIGVGTVNVKAKCDGVTYKCKVKVKAQGKAEYSEFKYSLKLYDPESQSYVFRDGEYKGKALNKKIPDGEGTFYSENMSGEKYSLSGSFKNGQLNGTYTVVWNNGYYGSTSYDNGTFQISTTTSSDMDYYHISLLTSDEKLYILQTYKDSGDSFVYHYTDDGILEKTTIADVLYDGVSIFKEDYSGFDMIIDSVVFINDTSNLSKKTIKKKAKYIEPKKISKNISDYLYSVDVVENAYVVQCTEDRVDGSFYESDTFTRMILSCDGYVYVIWYAGKIDVYTGDYITCYFTPFSNVSYTNIGNTTTLATTGVAYIIDK